MHSAHKQLNPIIQAAVKGNLDAVKRLIAMRTTKFHIPEGVLALLICDHPSTREGSSAAYDRSRGIVKKANDVSQTHFNQIALYLMKKCDWDILMLDPYLGDLKSRPENEASYSINRLKEKKHPMPGQDSGITLDTILELNRGLEDEHFLDLPQFQISLRMRMLRDELIEAIVDHDVQRFNQTLNSVLEAEDQSKQLFGKLSDSLFSSLCSKLRAFNYEATAESLTPALSSKHVACVLNGIFMDAMLNMITNEYGMPVQIDEQIILRILEVTKQVRTELNDTYRKNVENLVRKPFAQFCQENNAMHLLENEQSKPKEVISSEMEEQAPKKADANQKTDVLMSMYQHITQSIDLDALSENMAHFSHEHMSSRFVAKR